MIELNVVMPERNLGSVQTELEAGISLLKCQKCGCMEGALKNLSALLPAIGMKEASALAESVSASLQKMQPIQYSCLGCAYCYPAVAQNAFAQAFPTLGERAGDLSCEFRVHGEEWPPVVGEYSVLDKAAPIAVTTLASVQLAEELAHRKPKGLAIAGKTETENIGIDKVIKNIVTSPTIRYLIIAGIEPKGHFTGKTLLALGENGVDENGRVIGSPGKRPVLRNVSAPEIQAFREQVQLIDMLGCESADAIGAKIEELNEQATAPCGCSECGGKSPISISTTLKMIATEPSEAVTMDKAGYFVIVPMADREVINVEHYSYDNVLLRTIEGTNVRAIYHTIINNGWVTELSHAAYLGKELTKAELSLQHGFKYVQDGA
jgi:tetrahydromethanopterin S-methyltransferase subunit A